MKNYVQFVALVICSCVVIIGAVYEPHPSEYNFHRLDKLPSMLHHNHHRIFTKESERAEHFVLKTVGGEGGFKKIKKEVEHEEVHRLTSHRSDGSMFLLLFAAPSVIHQIVEKGVASEAYFLPPSAKLDSSLAEIVVLGPKQERNEGSKTLVVLAKLAKAAHADDTKSIIQDVLNRDKGSMCPVNSVKVGGQRKVIEIAFNSDPVRCASQLLAIADQPAVRWISRKQQFKPLNNIATTTMQSPTDHNRPIWRSGFTGGGQLVAVGDTGLDYDSCFFRDPSEEVVFYPKTNLKHRKIVSYVECVDDEGKLDHGDKMGAHGTHVAGSVAGHSIDSKGDYNGMAKDAKMIFHDLTCGADDGLYLPGDLYDYYVPSNTLGASVSSNSWGSETPETYVAVDKETDEFCYDHQDMLVIFAAGNSAFSGILSPAASKNVLTVGAHKNSLVDTSRENIAGFSSHGPTYDQRIKPELTAPGEPVNSASSDGLPSSNQCIIESKQGTSMATPHVAGSAILFRQYLVEGFFPTGLQNETNKLIPTASLLKASLIQATHPMKFVSEAIPNGVEGFGRLELQDLFFHPNSEGEMPYIDLWNGEIVGNHQLRSRCYTINLAPHSHLSEVRATLVWLDAASAAEGSHSSIVNDLDLVIVSAAGEVLYSNGKNQGTSDNVVEQIVVSNPLTKLGSNFQVHVVGKSIVDDGPYEGQPFSLVVWGPNLRLSSTCSQVACPSKCNKKGQCIEGKCLCETNFWSFDCGLCDGEVVCNSKGLCNLAAECSCNPTVQPSPHCDTCKAGYFGPQCLNDCKCGEHGQCDYTTGVCMCSQSLSTGMYGGEHCEHCAFDFGGPNCNQVSYWCKNKEIREVVTNGSYSQLIQINGGPQYPNSVTCQWRIVSPNPKIQVALSFHQFNIEKPYDVLRIYDGKDASAPLKQKLTGNPDHIPDIVSTNGALFLKFEADYAGPAQGFQLSFRGEGNCVDDMCSGRGHCNENQQCVCNSPNFDPLTFCAKCISFKTGPQCADDLLTAPQTTFLPSTTPPTSELPSAPSVCKSDSDCSARGTCSTLDGKCKCEKGFVGVLCEDLCPKIVLNFDNEVEPCNSKGVCVNSERCNCEPQTYGRACQLPSSLITEFNFKYLYHRFVVPVDHWEFATYSPTILNTQEDVVVRINLRQFPGAPSPIRLFLWNGFEDVGATVKAAYDISTPPYCVEVTGWHFGDAATTVVGILVQSTEETKHTEVSVGVFFDEVGVKTQTKNCSQGFCGAARCSVVPDFPPYHHADIENIPPRNTATVFDVFMLNKAEIAIAVGVGCIVGILGFLVIVKLKGSHHSATLLKSEEENSGSNSESDIEGHNEPIRTTAPQQMTTPAVVPKEREFVIVKGEEDVEGQVNLDDIEMH